MFGSSVAADTQLRSVRCRFQVSRHMLQSIVRCGSQALSQNVTLRFFPDGSEETCGYDNSTDALTFTTASIPIVGRCFNLADLFGGNATSGFVNQSQNLASPPHDQPVGIAWQLENMDMYDPQTNYSRVLYRQHVETSSGSDDRYKPDAYAYRRINIYGGVNCSESDPEGTNLLDFYGFDCFSDGEGNCGTTPYNIASFYITEGEFRDESEQHGKCMVFARMGAAAGHQVSKAVMGALLCASMAAWLVR